MDSTEASGKVQQHAALRNDYVEISVDFALKKALLNLAEKKVIEGTTWPERHKEFKAADASDVFDHYFKIKFLSSKQEIEFWGQTTCYKGNELGVAEANKTYEIRETLIEALSLRRHLISSAQEFRIVHFTFGPSAYTYGWFEAAKANTFDWSMYSADISKDYDIFPDLFSVLQGVKSELEVNERLDQVLEGKSSPLQLFLLGFIKKIEEWVTTLPPRNTMADKQAVVLNKEYEATKKELPQIITSSQSGGENIKGRVIEAITSGGSTNPLIAATLKRIYDGNGFISTALEALGDWPAWLKKVNGKIDDSMSLDEAINALWNIDEDFYITRRLLVRLFSSEDVHYPADLNIAGVTEHTLYVVTYAPEVNAQIVAYLSKKYRASAVANTQSMKALILSGRAKQIVVDSLKHDTSNGTNLKPSFFYVEEAIKKDFRLTSFEVAGLPLPVGYQTHFSETATVQSYGNLKVVIDSKDKPVAIIKAKYFRKQEFPRRAKEEAYVGLTAKYDLVESEFRARYKLPFIMFVDMDEKLVPPEFALVRLVTTGWLPIFHIDELHKYLKKLV